MPTFLLMPARREGVKSRWKALWLRGRQRRDRARPATECAMLHEEEAARVYARRKIAAEEAASRNPRSARRMRASRLAKVTAGERNRGENAFALPPKTNARAAVCAHRMSGNQTTWRAAFNVCSKVGARR